MNARVWKVDPESVRQRIRDWAEQVGLRPDVLAVVLFGSYARGDATAASDADVLIILDDSALPFGERLGSFKPSGLGVSVEVFPYTLAEARRSAREGWGVVPPALREGSVLSGDHSTVAELRSTLDPP